MKPLDLSRLPQAHTRSRLVLRRFRELRTRLVHEFTGPNWGPADQGYRRERLPLNLISYYLTTVVRSLIANNPRTMLTTFDGTARWAVAAMEKWVNDHTKKTHLDRTLRRSVKDALFSLGIVKVALATPSDSASKSWNLQAGMPFARCVDLDDFVYDVHARDWDEVTFIGHRYRAPLDTVKDSKLYSSARRELEESRDNPYNVEGDERIAVLGRGFLAQGADEFVPHVDLWEIYDPRERLVYTFPDLYMNGGLGLDKNKQPLRVQRWIGPDAGPYHILGFGDVPGSPMPKPPTADLYEIHDAVNRIYTKLIRQAERQKTQTLYRKGAAEDAERIRDGADGEMIGVGDPQNIVQVAFDQLSQQNVVFGDALRQQFNKLAGNIDLLAGAAPTAPTKGQEEMLAASSSAGIQDLQQATVNHSADVIGALCWYYHHHPTLVMNTTFSVRGLPGLDVPNPVTPHDRLKIDWDAIDVQVDPYSLPHQTPQQRLAALDQVMTQVIIPLSPVLAQQGIQADLAAYLRIKAKYSDMPELAEIVSIGDPVMPQPGQSQAAPGNTTRTYERVSRSAGTAGDAHQSLVNNMQAAGAMGQKNGTINRQ